MLNPRLILPLLIMTLAACNLTVAGDATATATPAPTQPIGNSANGQIAFVGTVLNNAEIFLINADGTGQTNLTNHPAADVRPVWSPDGQQIAFLSDRDGNLDIYLMTVNGSAAPLTATEEYEVEVAWSADGSSIAYAVADRMGPGDGPTGGTTQIVVAGANGSNATVVAELEETYYPIDLRWTPDGRLSFNSLVEGDIDVYIVNVDGSGLAPLVNGANDQFRAAWSPDSRFVIYSDGTLPTVGPVPNIDLNMLNLAEEFAITPLTETTEGTHDYAAWAPDGLHVSFEQRDQTAGTNGLVIRPMAGDLLLNIPNVGQAAWSRDSLRLAGIQRDVTLLNSVGRVVVIDANTGAVTPISDPTTEASSPVWRP